MMSHRSSSNPPTSKVHFCPVAGPHRGSNLLFSLAPALAGSGSRRKLTGGGGAAQGRRRLSIRYNTEMLPEGQGRASRANPPPVARTSIAEGPEPEEEGDNASTADGAARTYSMAASTSSWEGEGDIAGGLMSPQSSSGLGRGGGSAQWRRAQRAASLQGQGIRSFRESASGQERRLVYEDESGRWEAMEIEEPTFVATEMAAVDDLGEGRRWEGAGTLL